MQTPGHLTQAVHCCELTQDLTQAAAGASFNLWVDPDYTFFVLKVCMTLIYIYLVSLPSGRVVKSLLTAVLSTPFSTANTCSLYVTSGVSPDVVRKAALLNLSVCGVGMPAVRGVKVAL